MEGAEGVESAQGAEGAASASGAAGAAGAAGVVGAEGIEGADSNGLRCSSWGALSGIWRKLAKGAVVAGELPLTNIKHAIPT